MDVNGWRPGTYLVETGHLDSTFQVGASSASVLLPMTDSTTRQLGLTLLGSHSDAIFIEARAVSGGTQVTTNYPTFFFYGSEFTVQGGVRDLEGALVVLKAIDEDGGFRGSGHVERDGANGLTLNQVRIHRPPAHAMMDIVAGANLGLADIHLVEWSQPVAGDWPSTPTSYCNFFGGEPCDPNDLECHPCSDPHPPVPPTVECTDDVDNDSDGKVDVDGYLVFEPDPMCDHAVSCAPLPGNEFPEHSHKHEAGKYYAIFGDVVFCTEHAHDWKLFIEERSAFVKEVFENSTSDVSYNEFIGQINVVPVRWFASKCWILPTPDAARECRQAGGTCGAFDQGSHVYPYRGLGNARVNYLSYIDAMYGDYEHAVKLPLPYTSIRYPADFIQLLVWQGEGDYSGSDDWGGTTVTAGVGSVVNAAWDDPNNGNYSVGEALNPSAHEIGHLFGCTHCDWETYPGEGGVYPVLYDVMSSEDVNPECDINVVNGERTRRFSGSCANKLHVGINSRTAPAGGPHFGF